MRPLVSEWRFVSASMPRQTVSQALGMRLAPVTVIAFANAWLQYVKLFTKESGPVSLSKVLLAPQSPVLQSSRFC